MGRVVLGSFLGLVLPWGYFWGSSFEPLNIVRD